MPSGAENVRAIATKLRKLFYIQIGIPKSLTRNREQGTGNREQGTKNSQFKCETA
jgi:hypothetical protein